MIASKNLSELFCLLLMISSINVALLFVAYKWKLMELYQLYSKKWMHFVFMPPECDFCIYFRLAAIELFFVDWKMIPFAIVCAVMSRKIA